ncbi:MAG: peroxide stress protein YaaA, partial [Clostridiales bacterium]|nr:peroxide stress protein YaaA [Clostridiales bacterium]
INVFTDKSIKESLSLKKYFNSEYNKYADEILNVKKLQIISLVSSEFEEVFSKKYRDQFIKIGFAEEKYDQKEGKIKIKTHSTISKKARGLFVKYLSENKIQRVSDLLNNDINIYGFMLSKEYSDIELDEKNGIKKVKKIMYIKKY